MKKILSVLLIFTMIFALDVTRISADSSNDGIIQDQEKTEVFFSQNPFFNYDKINGSLTGILIGTTTDDFIDFYNMDVNVTFKNNNIEYSGLLKENSTISVEYSDMIYSAKLDNLEEPAVSSYAYNGTNFSMPLNKSGLLSNVSCEFGPYTNCGVSSTSNHNGIDFAYSGISNSSIYSAEAGTVASVNSSCHSTSSSGCGSGWGNYVRLTHSNGISTLYAHMMQNSPTVSLGQSISKSTIIGKVGSSGTSTGYHLHFEVYSSGSRVNPRPYLVGAPLPGGSTPTDPWVRVPETGYRFYPNRTINVRDYPSRSGNIMAQYYVGESFAYDSYVVYDDHIWLSYVSGSGHRRYVAWRVQGGEKFGTIY